MLGSLTSFVTWSIASSLIIYITCINVLNVYMRSRKFRNPLTPPNGGRSPQTKTTCVRVRRPIIIEGQVRGAAPPSGRNKKVPRPQKWVNPIFSKFHSQIFPKFFGGQGDPHHYRLAQFRENRTSRFRENRNSAKLHFLGVAPQMGPQNRASPMVNVDTLEGHTMVKSDRGYHPYLPRKSSLKIFLWRPLAAKPEVGVVT